MRSAVSNPGKKGWLVAILELGAWFGVLVSGRLKLTRVFNLICKFLGYLADRLSRKFTIFLGDYSILPQEFPSIYSSAFLATVIFSVGVIVQTTAKEPSSIYGGRFVAGLGLGSSSMAVPLYNAEVNILELLYLSKLHVNVARTSRSKG